MWCTIRWPLYRARQLILPVERGGTSAEPPKGRLLSMGLLDCCVAKLVSFSGALGTAFSTDWSEVGTPARHFPKQTFMIAGWSFVSFDIKKGKQTLMIRRGGSGSGSGG